MLVDNHGRVVNYVRIAVTDRCNLRCFYCMPHEGIQFLPKNELLTYEEILRLVHILSKKGVNKIRITGGEPFVRKDLVPFLKEIKKTKGIEELHITTNGVFTYKYLEDLKDIVSGINLSLDTLDETRFFEMTRRKELGEVLKTLEGTIKLKIPTKINAVLMAGKNQEDIIPLVELGRKHDIGIRFIEEMPFNGEGLKLDYFLSYKEILKIIQNQYGEVQKLHDGLNSTSYNYKIPGFNGTFGLIAAYSRTFCGTCNRLRITPTGELKTCLYEDGGMQIRDILRNGVTDFEIENFLEKAIKHRFKDGFEAEKNRNSLVTESMTTIGG